MDWVNSTLDLNLSKVEDTANGAVACQLLDIMYPNQVPMHKVNWNAKQDFEFVANYKILQGCFTKFNIERMIDVDRLISGRYMDNLEFMQWFKRFYEMGVSDKGDYDAVGQRSKGKGGATYGGGKARPSNLKPSSAPSKVPAVTKPAPATHKAPAASAASKAPAAAAQTKTASSAPKAHAAADSSHKASESSSSSSSELNALRAQNEESARAYAELKQEMEGLEKERDFYFEKLRDVEVLLQEIEDRGEGNELTSSIMKILYATAEGFEQAEGAAAEGEPESDLPAQQDEEDGEDTY